MPSRRQKPSKQEKLDAKAAVWPENNACPLCGRPLIRGDTINEHHLVPRMYGGTKRYAMHRVCHSKIHSVFTEKELAQSFDTFEKLRTHEQISRFITWIRKQNPEFIDRHKKRY